MPPRRLEGGERGIFEGHHGRGPWDVPGGDAGVEAVAHPVPDRVDDDLSGSGALGQDAKQLPGRIAAYESGRDIDRLAASELAEHAARLRSRECPEEPAETIVRTMDKGRDEGLEAAGVLESACTLLGMRHQTRVGHEGSHVSKPSSCRRCVLSSR